VRPRGAYQLEKGSGENPSKKATGDTMTGGKKSFVEGTSTSDRNTLIWGEEILGY